MRILYKYTSIDGERIDWIKRTLEGWIYFASPSTFNDPFELSPTFEAPNEQTVAKFLDKFGSLLTKSARARVVREATRKLKSQSINAVDAEWVSSLGVLCMASDPKNLLMWGHYGNSHKGVCLGFDASYAPFSTAKPIRYSSERPSIPLTESPLLNEAATESILLTKSPHWKYEEEWRAIKRPVREAEKIFYQQSIINGEAEADEVAELLASEGGHGHFQFEPQALRRVIIGARVEPNQKSTIKSLVSSKPWVSLYQAELDKKYFVINIQKEDPNKI